MIRTAWIAVLVLGVLAPASSYAQAVDLGLGRRLGRPLRRAPAPAPAPAPDDEPDEPVLWAGPQIQLGYAYWKLSDGHGGGDVHSATFEVFLQWPVSELRTGVVGDIGSRDYSLAGDDLILRGALEVGFQLTDLLDPLVPHISALFSFGATVGQRFDTTVAYGFGGGGIELGAELRLMRNLHVGASLAYLRYEMDGASFDVFLLKASVGL